MFNLARFRTKSQFRPDISLPSFELLTTCMAGETNLTDAFVPGWSTLSVSRPKFFLAITRTSYIVSFGDKCLATYHAITRWALMVLAGRKDKVRKLRVFFGVAYLTKQDKVAIAIVKMVSILVMYLKGIRATALSATDISSFYQPLKGMGISIIGLIFSPVRVVPASDIFPLVNCLTLPRAKGATDRRVMSDCHPTFLANTYGRGFMYFIGTSFWSSHNVTIAHTACESQVVK